jgi:hypothetical protein
MDRLVLLSDFLLEFRDFLLEFVDQPAGLMFSSCREFVGFLFDHLLHLGDELLSTDFGLLHFLVILF